MESGMNDLYKKIDFFLQRYFYATSFVVYSIPTLKKRIDSKNFYLREIYNKRHQTKSIKDKELFDFVDFIDIEDFKEEHYLIDTINNKTFLSFFLGSDEYQFFFTVCQIMDRDTFSRELLDFFSSTLSKTFLNFQKFEKIVEQNTLVNVDDVTGLFNQRKLNTDLDKWIERYHSFGKKFAILFMDIDHFKNVNDGHGHLVGTQVLADLGKALKEILRKEDYLYRYGGDEFVLIVPCVNKKSASFIGERILKTVKNREFKISKTGEIFKISLSIGIAIFPDNGRSRYEILTLADQMMYLAKSSGRGQVRMAMELLERY
jgi:diguanylate cyclase (GGDEF)-like protein